MKSVRDKWPFIVVVLMLNLSCVLSGWSSWGQFTQCSRPCDGGVKYRERNCVVDRLDRSVCKGKTISYKICNTHACEGVSRDFRANQCSKYNDQPLDGVLYTWRPYYGNGEKCHLLCFPVGFPFYHKFADKVIDGTPCMEDDSRRCIDGHCRSVGCDNKIGSKKTVDSCGVCGGNNSTCNRRNRDGDVSGFFDQTQLSPGHTTIVELPIGATNIYIREMGPNKNSIVFWDNSGLNFAIDKETRKVSPSVDMAGSKFLYQAADRENTYGGIQAAGPIDNVVTVYAVNEGADNPGIRYGYSMPSSKPRIFTPSKEVNNQGRLPYSESGPSNIRVAEPDVAKPAFIKPERRRGDDRRLENVHDRNLDNNGQRNDNLEERRRGDDRRLENVHDRNLDNNGQRSRDWSSSPEASDERYMWSYGHWTECSSQCGTGVQRRIVSCVDRLKRETTEERLCPENQRPSTSQPCSNGDCRSDSPSSYVRWQVGSWGACSTSCEIGDQVQEVFCEAVYEDGTSDVVDDEQCLLQYRAKPQYRRSCNDGVPCDTPRYMWKFSDWRQCSVTCGDGVQSRRVDCRMMGNNGRVPTDKCSPDLRPVDRRRCNLADCPVQRQRERPADCRRSRFGCCPDGSSPKRTENDNCMTVDQVLVKTGYRAVLDCHQYASRGSVTVEWTKQGLDDPVYRQTRSRRNIHPRYNGRAKLVDNSKLEIYPAYETDSGMYTCTVSLSVGDRERLYRNQVFLDVRGKYSGGHLGRDKTYHKINDNYFWKGMKEEIKNFIQDCDVCSRVNIAPPKSAPPLNSIPVPSKVWSLIGIDIIGPLETTHKGNKYIVAATDHFSKFAIAEAIPQKSAEYVAKFLIDAICTFGPMDSIISDQGKEFTNKVLDEITTELNIDHRISSSYHPQTNGQRERDNRTLKEMLQKVTHKSGQDWDLHIQSCLFAYRTSKHASTKFTPFKIMFGREAKLVNQQDRCHIQHNLTREMLETYTQSRETVLDSVSKNIKCAQKRQKKYYDERNSSHKTIAPETRVLIKNASKIRRFGSKLAPRWVGPYLVVEALTKGRLRLKNIESGKVLSNVYHSSNVKVYTAMSSESKPKCPVKLNAQKKSLKKLKSVKKQQNPKRKQPSVCTKFSPLTAADNQKLCKLLDIPFVVQPKFGPAGIAHEPEIVKHINGDGNCFFRAVSYAVSGTENSHKKCRNEVVKHMCADTVSKKLSGYVNQNITDYIKTMHETKT